MMKSWAVATSLLVLSLSAPVRAETADELAALQRQRDAAQARRDIATAEAEAAKARLGTFDSSGLPKGTGEAATLNVEGRILAYEAVQVLASKIATKIVGLKPTGPIALFSEQQFAGVVQLQAFLQQTAQVHKVVRQATRPGPTGLPTLPKLESDSMCIAVAPPAIAASGAESEAGSGVAPLTALSVGLQLLSIAKTDKKMVGADVTLSDVALANAVASKLIASGMSVVYPASYAADTTFKRKIDASKVIEESQQMEADVALLDVYLAMSAAQRQLLEKQAATRKADDPCKALLARDARLLSGTESSTKSLKASLEQHAAALVKIDDKSGTSTLQSLYASELLQARFKKDPREPYVLHLTSVAAGGTTLTKTNFFTTKFFFTGGAIVSYALVDGQSGDVLAADTVAAYGGFVKAEELSSTR